LADGVLNAEHETRREVVPAVEVVAPHSEERGAVHAVATVVVHERSRGEHEREIFDDGEQAARSAGEADVAKRERADREVRAEPRVARAFAKQEQIGGERSAEARHRVLLGARPARGGDGSEAPLGARVDRGRSRDHRCGGEGERGSEHHPRTPRPAARGAFLRARHGQPQDGSGRPLQSRKGRAQQFWHGSAHASVDAEHVVQGTVTSWPTTQTGCCAMLPASTGFCEQRKGSPGAKSSAAASIGYEMRQPLQTSMGKKYSFDSISCPPRVSPKTRMRARIRPSLRGAPAGTMSTAMAP